MKRLLGLFLITASSFSYAVPMTFTDYYDASPDVRLSPQSGSYQYTHNINDNGFNSATDRVLSSMLTIDVRDDGDRDTNTYTYYRTRCTRSWFGRTRCRTYRYTRTYTTQIETLQITADGTDLGSYEVDYSPLGFNIGIESLQLDGLLNVALSVVRGDLIFSGSTLVVETDRVEVPEPESLALLSLGLFGLFAAKRTARR